MPENLDDAREPGVRAAFQRVFQVVAVIWRLPLALAALFRALFPDRKTRWQAVGCLAVPAFFLLAAIAFWGLFIWFSVPLGVFNVRCEQQALATLRQQSPFVTSARVTSFKSKRLLSGQMSAVVWVTWYSPLDHASENAGYHCSGTADHFSLNP